MTAFAEPASLESAFTRYCDPHQYVHPPSWLTERTMQLSWKVAKQRQISGIGNIARSSLQVACYFGLVGWIGRQRGATDGSHATLCETGFNIGHSAVTFLSALPSPGRYIGFELGGPYTRMAVSLINGSLFPGQLEVVLGDSLRTVPRYLSDHPKQRCDVLSIDGDHSIRGVLGDWKAFKEALTNTHVVLFDDVSYWHRLFRPGVSDFDPGLHLVGCVSLPGEADDGESIHLFKKQKQRGRNVTRPMSASDGFCVARKVTARDAGTHWKITKGKSERSHTAIHVNQPV
jgi:hypothetical protein